MFGPGRAPPSVPVRKGDVPVKKRILCFLLALMLLPGPWPGGGTAFAAGEEPAEPAGNTEAADAPEGEEPPLFEDGAENDAPAPEEGDDPADTEEENADPADAMEEDADLVDTGEEDTDPTDTEEEDAPADAGEEDTDPADDGETAPDGEETDDPADDPDEGSDDVGDDTDDSADETDDGDETDSAEDTDDGDEADEYEPDDSEEYTGDTENDSDEEPWEGCGSSSDPYQLKSAEDLLELQRRVNEEGADYAGSHFLMVNDIALPEGWTPIGCIRPGASGTGDGADLWPFTGSFHGGGNTLTVPAGGLPLFGYVRGASVNNLNLYGPRINGDGLVLNYTVDYGPNGSYAGAASSTIVIDNVTVKAGTKTLRSGLIGGDPGGGSGNEYSQTSSDNVVTITNCTVEKGVVIGYDGSQSSIGSFAGQLNGTVSGCVSYAEVKGADNVGGIVGAKSTSMGEFTVSDCRFCGSVTGTGKNIGGIVGSGYDHYTAPNTRAVSILNCTVSGTVRGGSRVGGVFGSEGGLWQAWENGPAYIRNNTFEGTVSGSGCVGGVLGYYRSLNRYTVIENNICAADCGTDRGIGSVLYVDASMYANGNKRPLSWQTVSGWPEQIFCFDSSEDSMDRIKAILNPDTAYYNIARADHQRGDDPLGADLSKLVSIGAPANPYTVSITVSGNYKKEYLVGEKLDLTGAVFTVKWSNGETTNPTLSEVTVSKLDSSQPGKKTVTVSYRTTSTTIQVTVKKPEGKIEVTFSILGDAVHDSDADGHVHGLKMGGLTTWVPPKKYEADANDTVWDLMQRVMEDYGITADVRHSLGTVYVAGLTYRGVYLGEFTNGSKSGWQYTVNGHHPQLGVAQQYMQDKDKIIFHYTDDYTQEEGSEGYGDEDQKAADKVIKLIDAIPTPVTLDAKKAIEAARAAYDALKNYAQRSKVTNYQKLLDAEAELARLEREQAEQQATEEDKKAAAEVDRLIEEAADEESVKKARTAYEALTDLQKKLVKKLWLLEQKERELAAERARARYRDIYEETARYIESLGDMDANSQWTALGFARGGRKVSDTFYPSMVETILASVNEKGQLHRAKSSENSRTILVLTALGYDVTDVAGRDLLLGLTNLDYVKRQGINGPIWALIALDSHGYELPEDPTAADYTTREKIIDWLLANQLADGGWALTGDMSDSDMTGMCLQALAPYYHKRDDVTAAVDRALETLSAMQNEDGSFSAFGSGEGLTPTSESISQVLVALTALGIDPETDERFIKNGHSVVEALCAFFVDGGGFCHLMGLPVDGMATEQAFYALTAYFRLLDGKTALYDMTDVPIRKTTSSGAASAANTAETPTDEPDSAAPAGTDGPEENTDVALAVSAAEAKPEKGMSPLLWAVPGVGLLGLLTWWLDKMRRARRR